MVENMSELDRYPWCGHSAIMGKRKAKWQDTDYVLSWFGQDIPTARKVYRRYLEDGIEEGHREDLGGGGLIRTLGGWSQVLTSRKSKEKILCDERILGQDEFVERILAEADKKISAQISINERVVEAGKSIFAACEKGGVSVEALRGGSRRGGCASRAKGAIGQRAGRKFRPYHGRNGTAIRRNDFSHLKDI